MNIELEKKIIELVEAVRADQFPEPKTDPETGLAGPEYSAYEAGEHIYGITFNISSVSCGVGVDVLVHMQWPRFHMMYHELKEKRRVIKFETTALNPKEVHVRMSMPDDIIDYVAIVSREVCIDMLLERGVTETQLELDLAGPGTEAAAEDLWNEVLKYECL